MNGSSHTILAPLWAARAREPPVALPAPLVALVRGSTDPDDGSAAVLGSRLVARQISPEGGELIVWDVPASSSGPCVLLAGRCSVDVEGELHAACLT